MAHTNTKNEHNGQGNMAVVIKKTEKLSAAVHLVTGLVSDNEPIKWRLREHSMSLLSDSIALHGCTQSGAKKEAIQRAHRALEEVLSLLAIARAGDVVSEMNARVLEQEYERLREDIETWSASPQEAEDLVSELLQTDISSRRIGVPTPQLSHGQKDISKGQRKESVRYNSQRGTESPSAYKRQKEGASYNKAQKEGEKQERVNTILNLAKKKGHITVRDVAEVVSDCSEKTLQRELIRLVQKDVLEKEGEKRWSRYSLKRAE